MKRAAVAKSPASPVESRVASSDMSGEPARYGAGHWRWQRLSAVALIPLTAWFVPSIISHIDGGYHAVAAWIGEPWVAAGLIAYLLFAFFHAELGLSVIIEDYVAAPRARRIALLAVKVLTVVAGLIAIIAVLRVAL